MTPERTNSSPKHHAGYNECHSIAIDKHSKVECPNTAEVADTRKRVAHAQRPVESA